MKQVKYNESWPASWKYCYPYDEIEIYNRKNIKNLGYWYAYKNRQKATLDYVKNTLPIGSTILDVAAAQGNFSLLLAEQGYKVTWNDLREDLVDYVKLKYEKGKLDFAPGNVFDLGYENHFDAVIITEIIEHVAHPDKFLKKIAKLVKSGGYIIMTTPLGNYFLNRLPKFTEFSNPEIFENKQFGPNADDHIFLLHADETQLLAQKAQLKQISQKVYTNFLTNGHIKTRFVLKVLPKSFIKIFEKFTLFLPKPLKLRLHNNMAVLYKKQKVLHT